MSSPSPPPDKTEKPSWSDLAEDDAAAASSQGASPQDASREAQVGNEDAAEYEEEDISQILGRLDSGVNLGGFRWAAVTQSSPVPEAGSHRRQPGIRGRDRGRDSRGKRTNSKHSGDPSHPHQTSGRMEKTKEGDAGSRGGRQGQSTSYRGGRQSLSTPSPHQHHGQTAFSSSGSGQRSQQSGYGDSLSQYQRDLNESRRRGSVAPAPRQEQTSGGERRQIEAQIEEASRYLVSGNVPPAVRSQVQTTLQQLRQQLRQQQQQQQQQQVQPQPRHHHLPSPEPREPRHSSRPISSHATRQPEGSVSIEAQYEQNRHEEMLSAMRLMESLAASTSSRRRSRSPGEGRRQEDSSSRRWQGHHPPARPALPAMRNPTYRRDTASTAIPGDVGRHPIPTNPSPVEFTKAGKHTPQAHRALVTMNENQDRIRDLESQPLVQLNRIREL